MKSKNADTLKAFTLFCQLFPELRFWQALKEYTGADKIYISKYSKKWDDQILEDTYNKK